MHIGTQYYRCGIFICARCRLAWVRMMWVICEMMTAVSRQLMRGNCEGSLMNGELILPLMTNFLFRDRNNLQGNEALIYPLYINNVHLYCLLYCIKSFPFICLSLIFSLSLYLKCILYIKYFDNWCHYWLLWHFTVFLCPYRRTSEWPSFSEPADGSFESKQCWFVSWNHSGS